MAGTFTKACICMYKEYDLETVGSLSQGNLNVLKCFLCAYLSVTVDVFTHQYKHHC